MEPTPWTAPVLARGRAYSKHTEVKHSIQFFLKSQYRALPMTGYFRIHYEFAYRLPASKSKRWKKDALDGKIFPTKSDGTNCQKFIEDCLQGIVIHNDSHVIEWSGKKRYSKDHPFVRVLVEKIAESPSQ